MLERIKIAATAPTLRPGARPLPRVAVPSGAAQKPISVPGAGVLAPTPFTAAGSKVTRPAVGGARPEDYGLTHFTPFTPAPGAAAPSAAVAATPARLSRLSVPPGMSGTKFIPPTPASVFDAAARAAPVGRAALKTPVPMSHIDPFSGAEFKIKKGSLLARGARYLATPIPGTPKMLMDKRSPQQLDALETALRGKLTENVNRRLHTALTHKETLPNALQTLYKEIQESGSNLVTQGGHTNTPLVPDFFKTIRSPGENLTQGKQWAHETLKHIAENPEVALMELQPIPTLGLGVALPKYLRKVLKVPPIKL